jgi:hypothetical protein
MDLGEFAELLQRETLRFQVIMGHQSEVQLLLGDQVDNRESNRVGNVICCEWPTAWSGISVRCHPIRTLRMRDLPSDPRLRQRYVMVGWSWGSLGRIAGGEILRLPRFQLRLIRVSSHPT